MTLARALVSVAPIISPSLQCKNFNVEDGTSDASDVRAAATTMHCLLTLTTIMATTNETTGLGRSTELLAGHKESFTVLAVLVPPSDEDS